MRFSKSISLFLISISGLAFAQSNNQGLMEFLKQAENTRKAALDKPKPEWLRESAELDDSDETRTFLKKIETDKSVLSASKPKPSPGSDEKPELDKSFDDTETIVFISTSMGDKLIEEYMSDASALSEKGLKIRLVMRGMVPGDRTMSGTIKYIHNMLRTSKLEPVPVVQVNPPAFSKYDIGAVPAIVMSRGDELVASAYGLSINYFLEMINRGKRGGFGKMGPTDEIAERDLIDEMKSRWMAIDFEQKKRDALNRAWGSIPFTELPTATEDNMRIVSADIKISQDIQAQGKSISRAGDVINQLAVMPFRSSIIVFDGLSISHQEKVKSILAGMKEGEDVILLTTEVDRDSGFESFNNIQKQFKYPLYLLNQPIADRFQLEAIPAVIVADNDNQHFVVKEYVP